MNKKTIKVFYSCELCGKLDEEVEVKARSLDQDVLTWFERMLEEVRNHHMLANPSCRPKTLQNIKVPVDKDGEGVGFALKEKKI